MKSPELVESHPDQQGRVAHESGVAMRFPDASPEIRPFLERKWKFTDGNKGVVISGGPGVGTTTILDILAEVFDIPKDSQFKAGQERKAQQLKREGVPMRGATERSKSVDLSTDAKTSKTIRSASSEYPTLIDAQAGIAIAKRVEDRSHHDVKIHKVLATVHPVVGGMRVMGREEEVPEGEKAPKEKREEPIELEVNVERLIDRLATDDKSVDDLSSREKRIMKWVEDNANRHAKDVVSWDNAHPWLEGKDPQDPFAVDKDGRSFYDQRIDTTFISAADAAAIIIFNMKEKGIVEPVEQTNTKGRKTKLPSQVS